MNPGISVVIPTFKRPQLLIKCLAALKKQRFSPVRFEIIIVTDGPDEATEKEVFKYMRQYSLPVILCTSLTHKAGPAAARNKGARLAKGELIVFTDDDCIPHVDWLKMYWNAYCSNQQKEIAFTGRTIVPQSDMPTDYEKNIANLERAEFITANCACSRQAFERAGGFDEDFPIAWREDSDLHFKFIALSIPVIKVEEAIIVHPVRTAPWGISLKEQKKSKYNALLLKKHPSLYKQKIGSKPLYNYYGIVLLLPISIVSWYYRKHGIAVVAVSWWIWLITRFVLKRLEGTTKKIDHVIEMIATSVMIPFLSVFWTLYGSVRYKKLLL